MDIKFAKVFDERMAISIDLSLRVALASNGRTGVTQAIRAASLRAANRAKIERYEKGKK
jgi:hypothetical protein